MPAPSRLADADDLARDQARAFRAAVPPGHRAGGPLRKRWEFEYIADMAERLGLLDDGKDALGVAVGREVLIFHFAAHCRSVIATDLYSADSPWITARTGDVERLRRLSPFPFPEDRLTLQNADMRALPFEDASFDFCWSCSSIEHVDNLGELVAVYNEMARVLKPGGHAVLTTEFAVGPYAFPLPGVYALDAQLFRSVVQAHPAFEVVGPVDFAFDAYNAMNLGEARRYQTVASTGFDGSYHRLRLGRLAQFVGLTAVAPIGFTLRKRQEGALDWRRLDVPPALIRLSDAQIALAAGEPARARRLLGGDLTHPSAQHRMIAWRYYLDAVLQTETDAAAIRAAEDGFLAALPPGDVQDPDCAQMLAYSMGEHGRHREAADLFVRLSKSQSALSSHALALCAAAVTQARRAGDADEAVAHLGRTVLDLLEHGASWAKVRAEVAAAASASDAGELIHEVAEQARRRAARQAGARLGGEAG